MATVLHDAPVRTGGGFGVQAAAQVRRAASLLRSAIAALEALGPATLVELAPLFADAARVAEAGTLRCAQKAGDHGARRFAGERSAASLLSSISKTSLGKAKAGLVAAEKLHAAPVAERALWRGDLSLEQASAIAPVAAQVPDAAGPLVEVARQSSVKELKEAAARTLRNRRDETAVVDSERRLHLRRYCRTWVEDGGSVRLEALFGPKDGARMLTALDGETLRLARESRRAGVGAVPDQLRADALVALATRDLESGSRGVRSGGPQVLVRVDAAALQRGAVEGDEMCEIAGVGPVSVRVARELLCEGFLTLLVTDGVDVRTVTSTTRSVPARVEKALILRDVRCVVPGCGATERLEIDHWRTDFSWRGPTELANLCRLCPAHHGMKTRTGWQLVGRPGRWRWLPPKPVAELARTHGTVHSSRTTPRENASGDAAGSVSGAGRAHARAHEAGP
jgi:hypothetical protein